jgi:hypothetical protein
MRHFLFASRIRNLAFGGWLLMSLAFWTQVSLWAQTEHTSAAQP